MPDGEIVDRLGTARGRPGRASDVTICALGAMVPKAVAAAERLAGDGVDAEVIDVRSLVPLDATTILESVGRTSRFVTVEENPRLCGWGAEVASIVAEESFFDLDGPIVRVTTPHSRSRRPTRSRTSRSHRSNGSWRASAERCTDTRMATSRKGTSRWPTGSCCGVVTCSRWIPQLGDIAGGDVLIEGDTIAQVGKDIGRRRGDRRAGCVVIPGFVDTPPAHVGGGDPQLRAERDARRLLRRGARQLRAAVPARGRLRQQPGRARSSASTRASRRCVDWSHINNTPDHPDAGDPGAAGIRHPRRCTRTAARTRRSPTTGSTARSPSRAMT